MWIKAALMLTLSKIKLEKIIYLRDYGNYQIVNHLFLEYLNNYDCDDLRDIACVNDQVNYGYVCDFYNIYSFFCDACVSDDFDRHDRDTPDCARVLLILFHTYHYR